jgi:hypothetical protein
MKKSWLVEGRLFCVYAIKLAAIVSKKQQLFFDIKLMKQQYNCLSLNQSSILVDMFSVS